MGCRSCLTAIAFALVLPAIEARAQEAEDAEDDDVIDVTVQGKPLPRRASTLQKDEVRSLPGAFGDPFRAIEALPGVTPIVSGLPYFLVRGSPPANVGYFFDGVRVPALFHVALGPSVIHPVLIDRVELYSGAYPARYGRFAGGIVAADTAPPVAAWRGEGLIRVFDAGAMLMAPLPPDDRGSAMVAGRYSYTAAILSLVNPDVKLDYWDYQSRLHYRLSRRDEVSALIFGAGDFVEEKETRDEPARTLADASFHRLDLRWDHRPRKDTKVRLATTLGLDFFGAGERGLRDRSIGVRTEIDHVLESGAVVSAGADANFDAYDTAENAGDITSLPVPPGFPSTVLFQSRNDLTTGLWLELAQPLGPATFVPGLRLDHYTFGGRTTEFAADPRLAVQVRAHERVRLTATIGIAHQPPSFLVALPGIAVGGVRGGLQRSVQQSLSAEVDLPLHFDARATVFQNAFFNMTDPLAAIRRYEASFVVFDRMLGSSRGLELYLHRPVTQRIGGFVSYTLSRTERMLGRERFAAAFDRTHVLQTGLSWDLGHRWRAGSRLVFYTGFPSAEIADIFENVPIPVEEGRTLPFFRIDLRLEKRWLIGDHGFVGLVFEVLNATARREIIDVNCDPIAGCQPVEFGPIIIPSIGVEGGFF